MAGKKNELLSRRKLIQAGAQGLTGLLLTAETVTAPAASGLPDTSEWPMLARDAARSGATPTEVRPPFERKWVRLFPDEGLMSGMQPVVAEGVVYVGTLAGNLYAIDAATGKDRWVFRAGGPLLHSCAVGKGRVLFGAMDGVIYGLDARTGRSLYQQKTGAAIWNAPALTDGAALIGGRDGFLYCLALDTGRLRWKARVGGPLLASVCVDERRGRVYAASEELRVTAFDLRNGRAVWRSPKLPGVSFRGYHPVVAPDGSVMVTVTPALSLDTFEPLLLAMVKQIFGDFASWRHNRAENDRLREANFRLMEKPETYTAQLAYLRERLAHEPAYQTFFVLDPETGRQKFVTPIVYAESMNGTGAPPVVTPDGKVIVKFQALLRSRYEHYSPFLNVGALDTATGHITPIMDQSRTYGWHDSLLLIHDEQSQLVVGGRTLLNTHQDNVNGLNLETRAGYEQPFCRNIHEPKPGEAAALWARVLRGEPLPTGKEWLQRGTAVYGGGSVLDVPVTIAGDSFYYLPTHEISAGAAVIAYRMEAKGQAAVETTLPKATFTSEEWERIQKLTWDWDTLEAPRLREILTDLPAKVRGTRQHPLQVEAHRRAAALSAEELEEMIWQTSTVGFQPPGIPQDLKARLKHSVQELLSRRWQPLLFPSGKHPTEAYRLFTDPAETLYTLARAYPYLDAELQRAMQSYVGTHRLLDSLLSPPKDTNRVAVAEAGELRSAYDLPPEKLLKIADDIARAPLARLYPLWLWGQATGDWKPVEAAWGNLRPLVQEPPNRLEEDCRNGVVAGLIAYCRLAARVRDAAAVRQGVETARQALKERLIYEWAHPRGGLITYVPVNRSIFGRWRHLSPEVGRLCRKYAGNAQRSLMDTYVDAHRPTWWLAWNVDLMWRNEAPFSFPTMSAEIFAARALILNEPAERLKTFLDLPWCKADLFHTQKLVHCLEATGTRLWKPT